MRKGLFVVGKENEDRRLSREENKIENFELAMVFGHRNKPFSERSYLVLSSACVLEQGVGVR